MNTTKNTTATKNTFTKFCTECYNRFVAEIAEVRDRITAEFRENLDSHGNLFRLALNEAEFLAAQTEYPHLVYPALAMEKVQAVNNWRARQYAIRHNRPVYANVA
jgi:hypothetical protein